MSTLLTVQALSFDTAEQSLFNNLNFTLQTGDRIGLIGHNGSGKSTLLKLLTAQLEPSQGSVSYANHCITAYIEQHLPAHITQLSLIDAVLEKLAKDEQQSLAWQAEVLLSQLGFQAQQWQQQAQHISGGEHTRLLLARALIQQPDLLLLDEPSNHLDLPTLMWLGDFLNTWKGSFVLVSHDQSLLDKVTNCSWILRDQRLHHYQLPCSKARLALEEQDNADEHKRQSEQQEIDRIAVSAKRLALWGKVYDNEGFARKAKVMEKRIERLKDEQTELTVGYHWQLRLQGKAIAADRLLELDQLPITVEGHHNRLFTTPFTQLKSGERIAIIGANGCGKSTLMRTLWQHYLAHSELDGIKFHPTLKLGYYDQQLLQLADNDTLSEALRPFAELTDEQRKVALISAGFAYNRHQQYVKSLSGGERSRLLFLGLSLANYELLMLDEPTNHLDIEGKEHLCEQICEFAGGILLVSHDRWLIEQSCQRFWFIHNGILEEYSDVTQIYQQIEQQNPVQAVGNLSEQIVLQSNNANFSDDQLLEQLLALEDKLAADRQRKPNHQKPQLQQQWQFEIAQLKQRLNID